MNHRFQPLGMSCLLMAGAALVSSGCGGNGVSSLAGAGMGPASTTGSLQLRIGVNRPQAPVTALFLANLATLNIQVVDAGTGAAISSTTVAVGNQSSVSANFTVPLNEALIVKVAGSDSNGHTLESAVSNSVTLGSSATSQTVSLVLAPSIATSLVFLEEPAAALVDTVLTTVEVEVVDQNGFLLNGDDSTQVALALSPSGPVLGGTTQQTAANGIATFNNLTINTAGTVALQATATALTSASTSINVANAPGALTLMAGSPFAAGTQPTNVFVDPIAPLVYVSNLGSANVSGFSILAGTGVLSPLGTSPFGTGNSTEPINLVVDPSGQFVYVTDFGNNALLAFSITAGSGALTPIGSPVATQTNPEGIAVDPAGKFLYVVNHGDNTVSTFSITPGTGVPVASGSAVSTGNGPLTVTVDPSDHFAYVPNANDNTLSAFTITAGTGALVPLGTFATGTAPGGVTVDPSGRFVYVPNNGSSSVSAFTITAGTGALTAVAGSPFTTGSDPTDVVVDPSDQFLFVPNNGTGSGTVVAGFNVTAGTGVLTPIAGSPFATGQTGQISGVAVNPTGQFLYVTNLSNGSLSGFTITP